MSIDDDYYDLEDHLVKTGYAGPWDRVANHMDLLENANDKLIQENNELRCTIRTMMSLKEEE
jgi:hypothetical protein